MRDIKGQLQTILEKHQKWINNELDGECADLSHGNIRRVDLQGINLTGANLSHACSVGANFTRATLTGADLTGIEAADANFNHADMSNSKLKSSNFRRADLSFANFTGADLSFANLNNTINSCANFTDAILIRTNFLKSLPERIWNDHIYAYEGKRYFVIPQMGRRGCNFTYCFDDNILWRGCFQGTLEKFEVYEKERLKDESCKHSLNASLDAVKKIKSEY